MKKRTITSFIKIWIIGIFMSIFLSDMTVHAWGDNGGGRDSYTIDEINNGAIGATEISDGENYKESNNYPGTIVFNSISDSVIGHEKNFVGARECVLRSDGTWAGATKETIWNANEIEVEDGKTYIIRAFVHNDNPNGFDAVAEDTRVEFVVPTDSAKEIEVNGIISSSNATPSRYWDHVTFKSSNFFHLEYIENTALFENNGIGLGGIQLSNDVLNTGGTLIGYDKLDGRIPGCFQYDGAVTIKVKAVFDYDFMVETKVRLLGDKEWQDIVVAEVGDKVDFLIEYKNLGDGEQTGVVLRDILPSNLRLVEGSIKLKNASHPNTATIEGNALVGENGLKIGDYSAGANAFIVFTAEVVDDDLELGSNTLANWGKGSVGSKVVQDYACVVVYNDIVFQIILKILLALIAICLVIIFFLFCKMRQIKHSSSKLQK